VGSFNELCEATRLVLKIILIGLGVPSSCSIRYGADGRPDQAFAVTAVPAGPDDLVAIVFLDNTRAIATYFNASIEIVNGT
jgi:hypothetical protein